MPLTLSFGGSGLYLIFYLSVVHALRTTFPEVNWSSARVHCISGGCSGAIALLLDADLPRLIHQVITFLSSSTFDQSLLLKHLLPADAWSRLDDRLVIGTTLFPLKHPILYDQGYESQSELLRVLTASTCIPFFTGRLQKEMDGGFSHKYAKADDNTIVITLRRYLDSDLWAYSRTYLAEIRKPSKATLWELYQRGQGVVTENYQRLRDKIERGMSDPMVRGFVPYS